MATLSKLSNDCEIWHLGAFGVAEHESAIGFTEFFTVKLMGLCKKFFCPPAFKPSNGLAHDPTAF
jgi:hypothetical protein